MLRAKTTTARFKAPVEKLQAFVADINNLPKWATTFCKELKREGGDHKVTTPGGEIYFRIVSDPVNGIADMWGGPSKDQMMRWPVRIVDDGMGGSVIAFTNIQTPDQPDEVFDGLCAALEEEFTNIRREIDG
ncbi:MAG: hypothetical protein DHS20C08_21310 [Rhodomicrobium sp.]|nr:MAG: hypothetical protein DHS20C08_21310 [Rhodomicrobium sp.]